MKSTRYWTLLITTGLALALATPLAQTQRPPAAAGTAPVSASQLPKRFSGSPIDVDYASADLRKVLRQIADIGGVNLAIDPTVPVTGSVDLKLTQVPWDQVFDVVMQMSGLTNVVDGVVVRVLTREARTKELTDEALQKKASEKAPDLVTERLRVNYAQSTVLKKLIDTSNILSERGTCQADERANMLILMDVPANIDEVKRLVAELDKPEPQVEIEAKIIQANHDTARELGVQWGVNGQMSPQSGNATNLGFPNSIGLNGRTGNGTNNAVNLPAVGATSAIGLALGSINGAVSIDVALSALQHKGKLEILSQPKVVTQNNKEALMSSGFQIPYQTVSNNTTVINFKDAALKLVVTPHISSLGTVIMDVKLENGVPDFSRAVNGNPSINTQMATTQVQVADGATTAIGGIVTRTTTQANDSTPGMSKIPLLGWLFKHDSNKDEKQELVIFITPRIIR
jgi:type IV pilus assembly protein PilQ